MKSQRQGTWKDLESGDILFDQDHICYPVLVLRNTTFGGDCYLDVLITDSTGKVNKYSWVKSPYQALTSTWWRVF